MSAAPTQPGEGRRALAMLRIAPGGATLGYDLVDPASAQLSVLDLAATRGDGVFETISLGGGLPQALEPHLLRFASSAAMLELPAPDRDHWAAAVHAVAAELGPVEEGFVKIVLSRGIEGGDAPTGWAFGAPSPDFTAARTDGIRIVLLDRGYRHDVAKTSPWLLAGAKTLSYAVNRAAFREAGRRGADDSLFLSNDGYLLEGPVSTLIIRRGRHLSTPRTDLGILAGTTQQDLFRYAESEGFTTSYDLLVPDDLLAADGAWLVSSVRHAAPVRAVDGSELPVDGELSSAFNAFLRARTE